MFQLYDKLLQFSFFQGMSYNDLSEIVAHTKFDFRKYEVGQTVVRDGAVCDKLYLLTDGELRMESWADDRSYGVEECLRAPSCFQLERLFGLRQVFTASLTALTPCSLMLIDKREVMRLMDTFVVFHLNILNALATQGQKEIERRWQVQPSSLNGRVVRFFLDHCYSPVGGKCFHISMVQLAAEVNDSRLSVSRVLNHLQDVGLVRLGRERIEIPQLERLTPSGYF